MGPHLASSGPGCGSGWVRTAKFKVNCILPSVSLVLHEDVGDFIKRLFQSNQLPVTFNTSSSGVGTCYETHTPRTTTNDRSERADRQHGTERGVGSPTGSRPRGIDARLDEVRSTVASGNSEFSERVFHTSASERENCRCSLLCRVSRDETRPSS